MWFHYFTQERQPLKQTLQEQEKEPEKEPSMMESIQSNDITLINSQMD